MKSLLIAGFVLVAAASGSFAQQLASISRKAATPAVASNIAEIYAPRIPQAQLAEVARTPSVPVEQSSTTEAAALKESAKRLRARNWFEGREAEPLGKKPKGNALIMNVFDLDARTPVAGKNPPIVAVSINFKDFPDLLGKVAQLPGLTSR